MICAKLRFQLRNIRLKVTLTSTAKLNHEMLPHWRTRQRLTVM